MKLRARVNLFDGRISMPPAMRYPAYRNYWLGMLASVTGFQLFFYGQLWLIVELTGSPLFLGYVGLANAVPAILLNLVGGVFADKFNRRKLLVITQTLSGLLIFLLGTLVLLDWVQVWHVIVIAFFAGGVNAFDQPVRRALFPQLIERKDMMSAVALNSTIWQGTRIIAPAIAGFIIAFSGTAVDFYAGGAGFIVMAFVASRLPISHVKRDSRVGAIGELMEGINYVKQHSIFTFLIGLTFLNSFFGMAYFMLMPVIANDILKVGPEGMGILLGAGGVGALTVATWMSMRSGAKHYGLQIIGGSAMTGLFVIGFGATIGYLNSYIFAILVLFLIGASGTLYMNATTAALQMMVPDHMRGRIMGFHAMTWSILPLSGLQAGVLGNLIGVPIALTFGGIVVAIFTLGSLLVYGPARKLSNVINKSEIEARGW